MAQYDEGSEFLQHIACAKCGSSDANSEYTDGHTHCFACGAHTSATGAQTSQRKVRVAAELIDGTAGPLLARGISEDTCKHFGYVKGKYKGETVQIAPYFDADGNMVAQKIRGSGKKFLWLGDASSALPFGANRFPKSGKMIVVTEGEIDALAMSQVQGNRWPVVSISCGAGPQVKKYMAQHRAYFSNFEKVVLMFDMDEPGRDASRIAAEVLGTRARIAELPMKDAGEMLNAGKVDELINAMWSALPYTPSGIVEISSLREQVMEGVKWGVDWPWPALTKLTYGRRLGEIYAVGAGTGVGKTDLFTQIMEHTIDVLKEPIGVFSLEQAPRETAIRIAGKKARKRFHVPDSGWTMDEFSETFDKLEQNAKVFLYDSFGVNDWDVIEDRIRYLAQAEDVKHFFLDHLTALAASQDDERKALEVIMSTMGGLVKELNICIYLISHLATPEGKPHEEGGRVMVRHLKGSRSIGFWCHYIFGMERNQQAEDLRERHTTTFRVLKDRYTGQATGSTFLLTYNGETGMLEETTFLGASPEAAEHNFTDETEPRETKASDF